MSLVSELLSAVLQRVWVTVTKRISPAQSVGSRSKDHRVKVVWTPINYEGSHHGGDVGTP